MKRILPRNKKITVTRSIAKSGPLMEISLPWLNHFPKALMPEKPKEKED